MEARRSVLVIPPSFVTLGSYRRRDRELARRLTEFYEVYYLSWRVPEDRTLLSRVRAGWDDLLRSPTVYQEEGLNIVHLPTLRGPFEVAGVYNRAWLSKLIRQISPSYIFNASTYLHPLPRLKDAVYCYDFHDLPVANSFLYRRIIDRHVRTEIRKADLLTAVSHGIVEYLEHKYGRSVHYLPNGADMPRFEGVTQDEVEGIRRRFGLVGKFVIGYIGYFGGWSGLDFAVEVYKKFKGHIEDAVLFVVGSGEEVDKHRNRSEEGVIFAGAVDQDEVHKYFCSIDVGILTSPPAGFRNYSFPMKVIEYSAARKMVVSTPLAELKRINLPNVLLAEYGSVDEWVRALMKVKGTPWDPSWDQVIEKYDWGRICRKLVELLEGRSHREA